MCIELILDILKVAIDKSKSVTDDPVKTSNTTTVQVLLGHTDMITQSELRRLSILPL